MTASSNVKFCEVKLSTLIVIWYRSHTISHSSSMLSPKRVTPHKYADASASASLVCAVLREALLQGDLVVVPLCRVKGSCCHM